MGTSLTDYLRLIKPDDVEAVDIDQLVENWDKLDATIKKLPRGRIYVSSENISTQTAGDSGILWNAKGITLEAGRSYKINFSGLGFVNKDGAFMRLAFVKTANDDAPTSINNMTRLDPYVDGMVGPQPGGGNNQPISFTSTWDQKATETVQLKMNAWISVGTGAKCSASQGRVVLEDIGAAP